MTFGIDDAIAAGLQIINKYIPNPADKEKAALEMAQIKANQETAELNADTQIALAQAATNTAEAQSDDNYTRRARPTIIYICGMGFCYQYILQPFIVLLLNSIGKSIIVPTLDMTSIGTVLLGICGLRSMDKWKVIK